MERLVLIDGYSLMHRAFYAIPALSKDGVYTNALFGFFSMLLKVIGEARPDYLIVALDAHAPTFRHDKFADYKAGRKPMPEELRPQMAMLREVLGEIGIHQVELAGYEADDLLGTLSRSAQEQGTESVLVTGDRDSFQLIGEKTRVWFTKKGLTEIEDLTPEALLANYGIRPDQVPDLKGLMGDASDNIPGIAGVGEKTALKLLNEYDKLENVLDNADAIKGKLGERVRAGAQTARLSWQPSTATRPYTLTGRPRCCPRRTALRPPSAGSASARCSSACLRTRARPRAARRRAPPLRRRRSWARRRRSPRLFRERFKRWRSCARRRPCAWRTTAGGRRASPCRGTCSRLGWTSARRSRPCSPCSRAARRSACSTSRDGGRTLRTWASPWRRPIWTCASRGT